MASFNRVILMGNLTRDPEVRYIPSGSAVAEIGLAVNRYWFDKQANERREETTFVDVTLWGRTAEIAGEYLSKGRPVMIEGRLHLDQWEDRETGQKRSKLKVVGESMQLMGGRDGGSGGGGGGQAPQSSQQPGSNQASGGNRPHFNNPPPPAAAPAQSAPAPAGADPAQSFYDDSPSSGGDDEVPF